MIVYKHSVDLSWDSNHISVSYCQGRLALVNQTNCIGAATSNLPNFESIAVPYQRRNQANDRGSSLRQLLLICAEARHQSIPKIPLRSLELNPYRSAINASVSASSNAVAFPV